MNRFVVDKTGLTGRFDFKYEWTSDLATANALGDEASTEPTEVLVIDSVERPTPD